MFWPCVCGSKEKLLSDKLKQGANKFKLAATGRWAISARTYVLAVPILILINMERENLLNPGDVSRSLAICITGELVSWLFLYIAHLTLLKDRRKRQQSISRCLLVWFGAGVIKGVAFILYATLVFGLKPDYPERMVLPTIFTGMIGALLAFYFGSIDQRQIENNALKTIDKFLDVQLQELYTAEQKARVEAVKSIQVSLAPEISNLRNTAQELNIDYSKSEYRDALHEILRQSRALEVRIEEESKKLSVMPLWQNNLNLVDGKRSIFFGVVPQVISVRTSAVVLTLGMLSGQIPRNGPIGVASGLVGTALIITILAILRKISKRLLGTKLLIIIAASYPIVILLQVIHTAYLSPVIFDFDLPNPYSPWYAALKTIYGYYLASIVAGLIITNSEKLRSSRNLHERLKNQMAITNSNQQLLSEHILRTRFGTITGKIAGVSMALQLILNNSSNTADEGASNKILTGAIQLIAEASEEIGLLEVKLQDE